MHKYPCLGVCCRTYANRRSEGPPWLGFVWDSRKTSCSSSQCDWRSKPLASLYKFMQCRLLRLLYSILIALGCGGSMIVIVAENLKKLEQKRSLYPSFWLFPYFRLWMLLWLHGPFPICLTECGTMLAFIKLQSKNPPLLLFFRQGCRVVTTKIASWIY